MRSSRVQEMRAAVQAQTHGAEIGPVKGPALPEEDAWTGAVWFAETAWYKSPKGKKVANVLRLTKVRFLGRGEDAPSLGGVALVLSQHFSDEVVVQ